MRENERKSRWKYFTLAFSTAARAVSHKARFRVPNCCRRSSAGMARCGQQGAAALRPHPGQAREPSSSRCSPEARFNAELWPSSLRSCRSVPCLERWLAPSRRHSMHGNCPGSRGTRDSAEHQRLERRQAHFELIFGCLKTKERQRHCAEPQTSNPRKRFSFGAHRYTRDGGSCPHCGLGVLDPGSGRARSSSVFVVGQVSSLSLRGLGHSLLFSPAWSAACEGKQRIINYMSAFTLASNTDPRTPNNTVNKTILMNSF